MANVLLGVTGSVAAIKTPDLAEELRRAGHAVRVVATRAALYFFDPAALTPGRTSRDPAVVTLDEDEWPGLDAGQRWQRGDAVLHIELRRWADLLVIAPLDANTLAKLAAGLCDNCLTCVWRAWEPARPALLAPAMNTLMWQHPATARQLRQLAADAGAAPPDGLSLDDLVAWINERCAALGVVAPATKKLACEDVGVGALAGLGDIVAAVAAALGRPRA
jgi:phosphopantothenoylcysteine decarboxylase